jgi:hypothetical protein
MATKILELNITFAAIIFLSAAPLASAVPPSLPQASDSSNDFNFNTNSANKEAIDPREEELLRKERDLLRSLDLKPSKLTRDSELGMDKTIKRKDQPQNSKGIERPSDQLMIAEIPAPKVPKHLEFVGAEIPIAARSENTEDSTPKGQGADGTLLKELEHHPAIEQPIKAAPLQDRISSEDINSKVRTYPSEGAPDGTTARGVPSFYRIKRSPEEGEEYYDRIPSRILTVPIAEATGGGTLRPAAINATELAKVRTVSTFLRTGPNAHDSSLLKIARHSELRVDYRSGNWYRVRTEEGVRGWVPGNVLLFNDAMGPGSTVRIGGVRAVDE